MGFGREFLFLFLVNFVSLSIAQPTFLGYFCNYTSTSNSLYQANRDSLLPSLASRTNKYGFYTSSLGGEALDTLYALSLCRADVDLDTCRQCINNATSKLTQLCPSTNTSKEWSQNPVNKDAIDKAAIGWYDDCMVRYSNTTMEGIMAGDPRIFVWDDKKNITSVEQFKVALASLLNSLRVRAASGGTRRKFASGNAAGPDFQTIYALVQCTPDLSQQECSDCLQGAIDNIPLCCDGPAGGRVIRPSCNFRYEIGPFFGEIPGDGDKTTRNIIIIVVSTTTFVIILIVCYIIILRKRKQRKPKNRIEFGESGDGFSSVESLQYDFEAISIATDDFSDANKLEQGGFGAVYRGRLLNGKEIAVKRLAKESRQGEREFKNELMLVARLQHRNLVRLLGFCLEGEERLLIYEFVPNSSLDHFLFDPNKRGELDWERRFKIIEGIARGLQYLHEDSRLRVIHRDLKASNVLLDEEMSPKIADFGMARLFVVDETQGNTGRIVGTYGYMAPEYAMHGQFSVKSDVFSFGVLLLEIVSGQKNSSFHVGENIEDLLSYGWKSWRAGTGSNLIDPTLRDNSGSTRDMMRCIHIGLLCVQENVAERPTMASVVLMLSSSSLTLPIPSEPAFFLRSSISTPEVPLLQEHNSDVNKTSSTQSVDEVPITEVFPR